MWNDLLHAWVIVGFEEGVGVMTDNERFVMMNTGDMTPWFEAPNMITVDGDLHRRLRGALAPLFTRTAIARWEQRVNEVVGSILEPLVAGNDSFDLIADFTKIPTIIVADMLGVPAERHADLMRWSHAIVSNLAYGMEDEARRNALTQASQELNEYVAEEIERHRREPQDDLFTTMLGLSGPDAMSIDEIRSTGILLLVAGYDTTAKTMSNCLIAFERNPEQRRMIAEDLALVPTAIEEGLRWYGPVQGGGRIAAVDIDVAGTPIAAGDRVFVFRAAANRDPRRWERAHEFDLFRELKSHLGFGWGPHLCLGAQLARLEVKVGLEQLLRLAPDYRLTDIDLGRSVFIRGPEAGTISGRRPRRLVQCGTHPSERPPFDHGPHRPARTAEDSRDRECVHRDGSRVIHISGQTSVDVEGKVVGSTHLEQSRLVFRNVLIALAAAGATLDDVAKLNVYIVDYSWDALEALMEAAKEVFGDPYPVTVGTLVGVASLWLPDLLVEVDAVAIA